MLGLKIELEIEQEIFLLRSSELQRRARIEYEIWTTSKREIMYTLVLKKILLCYRMQYVYYLAN